MQNEFVCRVARDAGAAALAVVFASALPAHAQTTRIQQSEQILQPAGDVVEHDSFGTAAAISGNTMVIGGVNADGNEVGAGAAFIFETIDDAWVQTARLFASDGHAEPVPFDPDKFRSDSFGSTVAIAGDTVAVGAPGHNHTGRLANAGAVYVFRRVHGVWLQEAEMFSPAPSGHDEFGAGQGFGGIGLSGNTLAVTDQGSGFFQGAAVDVFTRTNGVWTLSTRLTVPDDPFFLPSSVAIDANTVAVGSSLSDSAAAFESGVAYVFRFDEGQWSGPLTLAAGDSTSGAQFGSSLSLRDGLIAVGAITAPGSTLQSGAVYLYTSEDGVWSEQAKLVPGDGQDFDNFGVSIAVSGQTVLVGANGHTLPAGQVAAGAAYVFRRRDGAWTEVAELSASDGISGGDFSAAVAVLDNTLVVGADLQHPLVEGYPGGEAYVYSLNPGRGR